MKKNNTHLIIGTGSNLGDKGKNLEVAKKHLQNYFKLVAESRIYSSKASDYTDQPDFFNQVLEFEGCSKAPEAILDILLQIETDMGRIRDIPKGPRIIDLDLLFIGSTIYKGQRLEIPHPRLFERSFVVLPLKELPAYKQLVNKFNFKSHFSHLAKAIK
ncbi:MAG: 2-amino-4-hydroxy-6-hydroxymethyldihydropteridine diphosphokinase [Bacteriovoracaceae bacterium]|nr:2-amino-4-hydroxy-6-hydroxymethyldihydropteridine diphosphokinase [Bacteriovoracaceae bacterium]